ncbi:MAG: pstS [Phenylobacterium sp.]|nr:pstS [Phenylobacterium sp.]
MNPIAVAACLLVSFVATVPALAAPLGVEPARPLFDLPLPTPDTAKPQSEAEKKLGMTQGRVLPTREVLQPTLDPALPGYVARPKGSLKGHYKAAVSDVLPGQVKLWVAAFEQRYPGVKIDIVAPYAGSLGAKELVKQNLDFVFVSRELRPDDVKEFHAKFGYDPLSIPVSGGSYRHYGFLDAVGLVVNRDNPLDRISYRQLDAILSTTRVRGAPAITTWGQLGLTGEWADKPIHVYAIKPWNGFEEFIRQRVLSLPGQRGEWRTDLNWAEVVFPIAGSVAKDRYALGYTGMAYVDAPVKTLAVGAAAEGPFYPPSYAAVATASYPLSRLIYFNVNKAPGKPLPPAVEEFLKFVLSRQGQALVLQEGVFIPLRGFQATTARAMLAP